MLAILLKILIVLGIVLLILLGLLVLAIVVVFFFPVSYRIFGQRNAAAGSLEAWAKFRWLFGLFKADYRYPDPGKVIVKLLGITIFDSGRPPEDKPSPAGKKEQDVSPSGHKSASARITDAARQQNDTAQECGTPQKDGGEHDSEASPSESPDSSADTGSPRISVADGSDGHSGSDMQKTWLESLLQRFRDSFEKIKYTILKICGKIKDIFEHFDYYRDLFQEEETRLLFGDYRQRLGKVLKSIRPRKINADIRFGTGSPDTTGYALGIYGMFSAFLGNHINVTPDFEEAVLEGRIFLSGRITIFVVLMNGGKLLLDRRLRSFIKRLKREDT